MITSVSHVSLGAENPERAAADYALVLAQDATKLADRSGRTLHRFHFGNIAFEITAVTDRTAGLQGIAFEVEDLTSTVRRLGRRGLVCEAAFAEHFADASGGILMRNVVPLSRASTHGVAISLVETAPSSAAGSIGAGSSPSAVTGLDHLVIRSPNPERAVALYGGRLGLDFALDRTNPEWGSRLLFFLCGGVRVEIGHALAGGISDDPDTLSGLAWRVPDAAQAQVRLHASGVQTSDAKKGRRPGSQVLTVRSNTCGVPTLFLSETLRSDAAAG